MSAPLTVTSTDLVRAGLTYRQIDFAVNRRWLLPLAANPGTGRSRLFPHSELRIVQLVARLIDAGLETGAAYRVARELGADGRVELAPGVLVEVTS